MQLELNERQLRSQLGNMLFKLESGGIQAQIYDDEHCNLELSGFKSRRECEQVYGAVSKQLGLKGINIVEADVDGDTLSLVLEGQSVMTVKQNSWDVRDLASMKDPNVVKVECLIEQAVNGTEPDRLNHELSKIAQLNARFGWVSGNDFKQIAKSMIG